MRSLPHEAAVARTWTPSRHETWDGPTTPIRRARLRRLIRQGLLLPAQRVRRASAADEQVPADDQDPEPQQQARLPDPARIAAA
jgi:hypothetical protein